MNRAIQTLTVVLVCCVFTVTIGCDPPKPAQPAGLSMAELEAQNRAPLDIVSFHAESGVGDVILGMALEAEQGTDEEAANEFHVGRALLPVAHTASCTSVKTPAQDVTGKSARPTYFERY